MSLAASDLGVLEHLAVALGLFTKDGPNPDWFGDPGASLATILSNEDQRKALIDFVDEALGGPPATSDPWKVVWLPIVALDDPDLTVAVTIDAEPADGTHIGLGILARTASPPSETTLAIPLFRVFRDGQSGQPATNPVLLGTVGGRIRVATSITIDAGPATPGQARLGAIGLDVDLPTVATGDLPPIFGLNLKGFQLPGAQTPRDIRVAADGLDELDDALLDLVLSLVKAQADAAAANSPIAALGGLLGLRTGDNVPDFPITQLPVLGPHAIAAWIHDIVTTPASRTAWLGHVASLFNASVNGDTITFTLGGTALALGLRVDAGPTGNTRLTPTLGVKLGDNAKRAEARADLFQIDLVTGAAIALPQLGVWCAAGAPGAPVLDESNPEIAKADALRVGFALDAARKLTFVLAADNVTLGTHTYPTLDLTSPDAVKDAVGNAIGDIADQLLASCGGAEAVVRLLLGLNPPAGVSGISLASLMTDPLAAVAGYWKNLTQGPPAAMTAVLTAVRDALADTSGAATSIKGTGTAEDPWRVALIGPLELEASIAGSIFSVGVAATTSVDTLGQQCTVVITRVAATLAQIDLTAKTANLLPAVEGVLSARERGANPPRVVLPLGDAALLTASLVGLRLGWSPDAGLRADVRAPNLALTVGATTLPIALPQIAADGSVTLPPEAWDGVEALVGYLGELLGGFLGNAVAAVGWSPEIEIAGGDPTTTARLPLRDLVADPANALALWLPRLLMSDLGPEALRVVADLFKGSGANHGFIEGTGHPDDPYRFALTDALPSPAVWFPPAGLEPRVVAVPEALMRWRPGDPGLGPDALAAALQAESDVADDIRDLIDGRAIEGGLTALATRWIGGDGRIVPPDTPPAGITIDRTSLAAGQLLAQLDFENVTGRVPTTTVYVAIGSSAWPQAPAGRRIDLTAPMLAASMFTPPTAATGDWFVALGGRADCLVPGSATDGTPEQAARLARVLSELASVSSDIALVALAGAGHAARAAADTQPAVTDLITLGTPLGPISLTAINTQPTADALRLLHRLLPTRPDAADPDVPPEDSDLALGRALVGAMMDLVDRADPSLELRLPTAPLPPPRAGLAYTAVFGTVTNSQVSRAMTAIVAAGLAERARIRAATPLPEPTGLRAGVRLAPTPSQSGTLQVRGDAVVTLFSFDTATGIDTSRHLRVRVRFTDRLSWLVSTPDMEVRMVSADVTMPLDGNAAGQAAIILHDASVFGPSWERLVLGNVPGAGPVLPEARVLLAAALQRLTTDDGSDSIALELLLTALGILDVSGGVAASAVDQLALDPAGLIRQRLVVNGSGVSAAIQALLGPLAGSIDLGARSVHVQGGSDAHGRFGWDADVTASTAGLTGHLRIGPSASASAAGHLNLLIDFDPFHAALAWHQAGGAIDTVTLWPSPDAAAIARVVAKAAPSLGGHAALELMRRADETARPLIDAVLDALGMLAGSPGDPDRAIRPLAGLLSDPAGWLRSADSLAANPAKIQGLFDALRPLLDVGGAPGSPIPLANGVSLSVVSAAPGAQLSLDVDPTVWTAPAGITGRFASGLGASLTVKPTGPPAIGLHLHVGLTGAAPGHQAIHAQVGAGGVAVFVRPASGADIPLVPFAGLGSLAAAAEAALPFLLDRLAGVPDPVGKIVRTVGDALALRIGGHFDGAALHQWAADPAAKLLAAVESIKSNAAAIATAVGEFAPSDFAVSGLNNTLSVTNGAFSLQWDLVNKAATVAGTQVVVPGIEHLTFTVAVNAAGLKELSATLGPAAITAGGVTLRPFATVAAGSEPANGRRVAIGMALNDTDRFAAKWLIDSGQLAIVASSGEIASAVDDDDPAVVAARIVQVVADLVASVAMAQQAVQTLLDTPVGVGSSVRKLLQGVVLEDTNNPQALIAGLFTPDTLLARFHRLFSNIAAANIQITVEGLKLSFATSSGTNTIGLLVELADRLELVSGDVMLWLENEGSWIDNNTNSGLFVGFLPTAQPLQFTPSLGVFGVGLRIGKSSGPLLDVGLTLESIALHAYAEIGEGVDPSGGLQLQFSNLAVSASGAGGDNGIAQGVMRDTGPTPPKPAFSPALAIQKHGNAGVSVSLRAGDPPGPWWIAIQRGFGPLYIEQVGFGVTPPQGKIERVSLLMDGSVSMFGLTCAVDDLQITYITSTAGHQNDFFNPASWAIDLAGLAVSADMAGVKIAGGLLKQTGPQGIEYLGMLLGRFAVYGLTIYGGYGEGTDQGQKFTAFFAVGAINGPIGGPPAFFLIGIGGGFGINRKLVVPADLSRFGDYPLIQALDIAASPQDPMNQLRALGQYFPMAKATFWFAAGLAFNSFALVDGIAVVAVQIGDGLDINLLGLARMALPRPQVALVSIEVALLVRFSSSEGVLWVQGQLTDNSWLLYPDIKLTGGFAYVIWFKGEHSGEFVFTLGGYHPDFHRDGYPVVPRLGLRWSIGSAITVKAGSYFALTSEALMAGGDFEASAHFGPAWAELKFGAHGIIYFDPFHYHVNAYLRIAAGVTIDTYIFGEVTISISIGARIDVTGPDFHGKATFEVGPIELTVEFGGSDKAQKQPLAPGAFIAKYLEDAGDGTANAHAVMTSFGSLPSKGDKATPDGSADRPFIVVCEFGLTFTSTVPAATVTRTQAPSNATTQHPPSRALGVAPMNASSLLPTITLEWRRSGTAQPFPFTATARPFGSFPVGVWGPPQDQNNRKVPKAEMVEALNELDLESRAAESPAGPEIPYYQVEIGKRRPLPFTRRAIDTAALKSQADAVAGLLAEPVSVGAAFDTAAKFLAQTATPTALASLRGERQSPPLLGTLAERIIENGTTTVPGIGATPPGKVYDHFVDAPIAVGLLSGAGMDLRVASAARTTVKDAAQLWRVATPTLANVEALRSRSIAARLVLTDQRAARSERGTVIAINEPPPTAVAHAVPALIRRTGGAGQEHLDAFTAGLITDKDVTRGTAGATLSPGQIVVLRMPNAHADTAPDYKRPSLGVTGGSARIVILDHGGKLLTDRLVGDGLSIVVPRGAERIVALGQGKAERTEQHAGLVGWHAGMHLPYAGWSTAIAPGCVVRATSDPLKLHRERLDAGWVTGAELARGVTTVTTTFPVAPTTVAIVLDDPTAFGDIAAGRTLLLGLDGAERARDAAGRERPPQLLTTDNRSIVAYDIVPERRRPVAVTIASEEGWSLVGVLGSAELTAAGAIGLIADRGLDAAMQPFAAKTSSEGEATRLRWLGPTRSPKERYAAQVRAGARAARGRR